MVNYIFTGRFQPLHKGHISFLECIKKQHPDDLLIICIIRNTYKHGDYDGLSNFCRESLQKHQHYNNPLPNWNRYVLLSLAVKSNQLLKNNTEIIFRNRSDIDWEDSVIDLPKNRVWVLPKYSKESFDFEKQKYYLSKNEQVELIDFFDTNTNYSAGHIRRQLKNEGKECKFDFLPDICREYFNKECLKYFS